MKNWLAFVPGPPLAWKGGRKRLQSMGRRVAKDLPHHGNHAPFVVLQVLLQLILKLPPVYRLSALSRSRGIAGLDDEAFNVPVEQGAVVVIRGAEGEEVLTRLWTFLAEQLHFQVTNICVQRYGLEWNGG